MPHAKAQEQVVGCAGVSHCDARVRLHLDTGTGQRPHLHVEAVPVHVGGPVLGEVDQPTLPVATALFTRTWATVEPSVASFSYQNDSSRAIIFMGLSFHYRRDFPGSRAGLSGYDTEQGLSGPSARQAPRCARSTTLNGSVGPARRTPGLGDGRSDHFLERARLPARSPPPHLELAVP